jgi:ribosomal protein L37AE/L43A
MANAWKCTKCNMVAGGTNKPLVGSCPKGGGHTWTAYGVHNVSQQWQCGKCGMVTAGSSRPNDGRCPKGGGHTWRKRS